MDRIRIQTLIVLTLLGGPLLSVSPPEIVIDRKVEKKLADGEILTVIEKVPHSKTRRCRAFAIVDAPIDQVWAVVCDYNNFSEFMPRTPVSFVVDPDYVKTVLRQRVTHWKQFEKDLSRHRIAAPEPGNPFHHYSRFDMPWPLRDRFTLTEMICSEGEYFYEWRQVLGNMKDNRGSWLLKPFPGHPGKNLVVYTLYANPGIFVPAVFVKMAVKGSLPGVVQAVRNRIRDIFPDGGELE